MIPPGYPPLPVIKIGFTGALSMHGTETGILVSTTSIGLRGDTEPHALIAKISIKMRILIFALPNIYQELRNSL